MPDLDPSKAILPQIMGDKVVAEWGKASAPVQVTGYVPESECHAVCIKMLVQKAIESPSKLHVKLVRMNKPEGGKITEQEHGKICAGYAINGTTTVTLKNAAGVNETVTFERSPESGTWSPEQLRLAVEQAIVKAK
jgi:hypothetical protein